MRRVEIALVALCCGIILSVDLLMPLGVAAGVPYVFVVAFARRVPTSRTSLVIALLCTGLIFLGWFASPEGGTAWKVFANRGLAIAAIWGVAILVPSTASSPRHRTNSRDSDSSSSVPLFFIHDEEFTIAPESGAEFLATLERSRILETGEFDVVQHECQKMHPGEIARHLVDQETLTKYQATLLFHGQSKGLVFGDYIVLDSIGRGGVGVVLRATHRQTGESAAIKVLHPRRLESASNRERFDREISAALKLSHSNIVAGIGSGWEGSIHYLVMEHIDGPDLHKYVDEYGHFSTLDAGRIILEAAQGVKHAHENGVIHRDLKPSNLILSSDGKIKVLDLGLARIAGNIRDSNTITAGVATMTGVVYGSLDFMSPEQAVDFKSADERSDIYSLGCTFYFLATGHSPAARVPNEMKLRRLQGGESKFKPVQFRSNDAPRCFNEIVEKMTQFDSRNRFQSVDELISRLEECLT